MPRQNPDPVPHQNRVIAEKQDVLDSYEDDAEVAKLDAEAAQFAAVVAKVGAFHQAPQPYPYP